MSKFGKPRTDRTKKPARTKRQPGRYDKRRDGRKSDHLYLYGMHSVRAALANDRRVKSKLYVTPNSARKIDQDLLNNVETVEVDTGHIDWLVGADKVHQGIALECQPLENVDASELFRLADAKLVLALDQITDPHNVGAILRSAVAFNVDAVLITHRQSAVETAILAKSASGALDMVTTIEIRNLSKAIAELNDMGFVSIGLDSEGNSEIEAAVQDAGPSPKLIVLGSEGKGLREKTRETCSCLAKLSMPGEIKSLNVSNAAALALYVAQRAS